MPTAPRPGSGTVYRRGAEAIAKSKPDNRHLVFAPARFVFQRLLNDHKLPVEFAPLPFALYRVETS